MKRAVRGRPPRTAGEVSVQNDVVEYIVTTNAGLSRRDIRGEQRRGYHIDRRTDIAATARRVLGRLGRLRAAVCVGAAIMSVGIAAALAGLESTGVFVCVVAAVVATGIHRYTPPVVFDADVNPSATVTRSATPGMTPAELTRHLTIHGEREELKQEQIEKQRKRQERKANARPGGKY